MVYCKYCNMLLAEHYGRYIHHHSLRHKKSVDYHENGKHIIKDNKEHVNEKTMLLERNKKESKKIKKIKEGDKYFQTKIIDYFNLF